MIVVDWRIMYNKYLMSKSLVDVCYEEYVNQNTDVRAKEDQVIPYIKVVLTTTDCVNSAVANVELEDVQAVFSDGERVKVSELANMLPYSFECLLQPLNVSVTGSGGMYETNFKERQAVPKLKAGNEDGKGDSYDDPTETKPVTESAEQLEEEVDDKTNSNDVLRSETVKVPYTRSEVEVAVSRLFKLARVQAKYANFKSSVSIAAVNELIEGADGRKYCKYDDQMPMVLTWNSNKVKLYDESEYVHEYERTLRKLIRKAFTLN